MGQIVSLAAKPKRCNLQSLSSLGTPAAGEYILVSSDNSMNAAGQGNFDCYIEGNGTTAAIALERHSINEYLENAIDFYDKVFNYFGSGYKYYPITLTAGVSYTVVCSGNGDRVNFRDSSKNIIKSFLANSTNVWIPTASEAETITQFSLYQGYVRIYHTKTIADRVKGLEQNVDAIDESVDALGDTMNEMKESLLAYENVPLTITSRGYISTSLSVFSAGVGRYSSLAVAEGEIYRITSGGGTNGTYPSVFFYNNGSYVSTLYTSGALSDAEIIIPAGVDTMYMNSISGDIVLEKLGSTYVTAELDARVTDLEEEVEGTGTDFEFGNLKRRCSDLEIRNDFAWRTYDKAYVSFCVDDGINSAIANSFINANVPLCLALSVDHASGNYNISNDPYASYQEIISNILSAGGEIMTHSSSGITSASTKNDYDFLFRKVKKYWFDNGIDVNGIITPGVSGYTTANFEECVRWCRMYYRYSDNFGTGTGVIQYYHPRIWIKSSTTYGASLDAFKARVNEAVDNKEWVVFFFHPSDNMAFSIDDALAYINSLVNLGSIGVTNYANLYRTFGSSVLEQRIAAIED